MTDPLLIAAYASALGGLAAYALALRIRLRRATERGAALRREAAADLRRAADLREAAEP